MHWLCWILGILVLLLVLLCLTRLGITIKAGKEGLTLDLKLGLIRFRLFPKKQKDQIGEEETKKSEMTVKKKSFPKPTMADIKEAAKALVPPLMKALERTRRGIRVHPLQLSVTLGGREDPASTAELYGYLHTGMWTVMPQLERFLDIPDPRLHIGMDFDAERTVFEGEAGISIRVGTLLTVGMTLALPVLRFLLRYRKKQKMPPNQTVAKV